MSSTTEPEHDYKMDELFDEPVPFDHDDTYPEEISKWFNNSALLKDTNKGYVYYESPSTQAFSEPFLCTNWAAWRTKKNIRIGSKAPRDGTAEPIDATRVNVKRARDEQELLKEMRLHDPKNSKKFLVVECAHNDPDRMLIFWSKVLNPPKPGGKPYDPDQEIIAHVSVRPNDRGHQWESKASRDQIVILHDENLYKDFVPSLKPGEKLRPALYYKYAE